jgi:hypothetical protein
MMMTLVMKRTVKEQGRKDREQSGEEGISNPTTYLYCRPLEGLGCV